MVREVYWNTGASDYRVKASAAYTNEIAKQTVKGYVGLMNTSDYGYATSGSHTTNMDYYNNVTHTLGNWLYANTYEWTIMPWPSNMRQAHRVNINGNIYPDDANYGYGVRPVLYLDTKVYIVSVD